MWRAVFVVVLTMLAATVACRLTSHADEVLVAGASRLGPEWTVFRPGVPLKCRNFRSEVLVELPQLELSVPGLPRLMSNGAPVTVEAEVLDPGRRRLRLDKTEMVAYNKKVVLVISAATLDSPDFVCEFAEIAIRASAEVHTGKILWVSYNPSEYSSGVYWPKALTGQ